MEGIHRPLHSDYHDLTNLGQGRMVSINKLFDVEAAIAGRTIRSPTTSRAAGPPAAREPT